MSEIICALSYPIGPTPLCGYLMNTSPSATNNDPKSTLRSKMRQERCRVSTEQAIAASEAIRDHLSALIPDHASVAVYAAIQNEPSVSHLHDRPLSIAYPRCVDRLGSMVMVRSPHPPSRAGAYGILEPQGDDTVLPETFDAVLVPGLAFDMKGNRLGFGAGYYDRFLSMVGPQTLRIGIGYDWQIVDSVPVGNHDIHLTHIITDQRLIDVRAIDTNRSDRVGGE